MQKLKNDDLLYVKLFEPFKNININNSDILDFQEEFIKGNFDEYITGLSKQFNNEINKLNFTSESSKKNFLKILLLRKIDKMKNEQFYIQNEKLKKEINEKNIYINNNKEEYTELENTKNKEIKDKDERIDKLMKTFIEQKNIIKNIKKYFLIIVLSFIILQQFINYYGLEFIFNIIKYILVNIIFGFVNYIFTNFYFIILIMFVFLVGFQFIHLISYNFPFIFYKRNL
jgi:hypothetical protein